MLLTVGAETRIWFSPRFMKSKLKPSCAGGKRIFQHDQCVVLAFRKGDNPLVCLRENVERADGELARSGDRIAL